MDYNVWYFLELVEDLLDCIDVYHIEDAIAIDYGYQKHSIVWKVLNQSKYIEIFLGQQENCTNIILPPD